MEGWLAWVTAGDSPGGRHMLFGWHGSPLLFVALLGKMLVKIKVRHLLVGLISEPPVEHHLQLMRTVIHALAAFIQLRLYDRYCMCDHHPFAGSTCLGLAMISMVLDRARLAS